MTRDQRIVTVVGGTGFIGRYVVQALAKAGYTVRVISRSPALALRLKTAGHVGQVVLQKGNITKPETIADKLAGSYAVINLVGILAESGRQNFTNVHAKGAETLAKLAAQAGVTRFVQLSALSADAKHPAAYARSKAAGEAAVLAAFPRATILRPSVVFGPEDDFYNRFASLARFAPALPLIGGGKTRFQPVYAVDVAQAAVKSLELDSTAGQTYELGGPQTYSFKEILQYILETTRRRKTRLSEVPFFAASLLAKLTGWLPGAPLTADQVELLKRDSVVKQGALTFDDLGITPTAVEAVAPSYLARYASKTPVAEDSAQEAAHS